MDREAELRKYKWQFLRRNRKFLQDALILDREIRRIPPGDKDRRKRLQSDFAVKWFGVDEQWAAYSPGAVPPWVNNGPYLSIDVNLTFTDHEILKRVKEILRDARQDRGLTKGKSRAKAQFAKYELYLKVFDLKLRGVKHDEVTDIVFGAKIDAEKIDLDSARAEVSRYYKKAKSLVKGGYRDLR